MKKRTVIRIISFFSAAIIVAGGLYLRERSYSAKYKLLLQNEYSSALSELDSGINQISEALEKVKYIDSAGQLSSYAAQLYSAAELSKSALSKLPAGNGSYDTLYRFLSQVGNYALYVTKSVISGNSISDDQKEGIAALYNTAQTIAFTIGNSQISFNNADYWAKELNNRLESSVSADALADSLTSLEENLTDYPTLIYDGPYSDHIINAAPLMLENAETVTREEAQKTANKMVSDKKTKLNFNGMESGKIACYRFMNDDVTVTVSRKGGYPVYMRKNRVVEKNVLSYDQALLRAKNFMSEHGFTNMTDTYFFTDEGICVINFAFLDGQTFCYPDLMKVGVAMDNGEIMLYEAAGYLTNHTDRAFETPAHTSQEAMSVVNPELTVKESSIVLIPTDGGNEMRCYEFLCLTSENNEVLIYVDMQNLTVCQVMLLLKTDGGTLVK